MKEKQVLVIGLGRLGTALVNELWDTNVEILVVDKDEAAIEQVKDKTAAAFVGDGSDPRVLEGINAKEMDVAVVTAGEDFESSVLTVAALAQLKVPHILVRGATERQASILRTVGATRVFLVEDEMGRRLATEVLSPASSDFMEYASSFRVMPWVPSGDYVGKTLVELDLRKRHEITVLGCWRGGDARGKKKPAMPTPDYRVAQGDTLLVIGLHQAVEAFFSGQ
ncbi:MAG: TrkA family potassium uptake protein [Polyangiaceae bacterium]|jgi:trk system potassium uptake protein TrkA|nr:TrkA family potassium uptake protein [Polyangiaceae bacterium]MBK8942088.1 TrkA family potassium uptake protein [Polyangiaceae bacterium]